MADRSTPRPTSLSFLLLVYIALLIGGIALFYIIVYAAEAFFGLSFPESNSMGLVIILVAANSTGTIWFNREQVVPSSGRKWALAALMCIATTAVQGAMFFLLLFGLDEVGQFKREFAGDDRMLIVAALLTVVFLQFLLLRASLWFGIRTAAKRHAALAAKA
ncbi:ABZJ_00895 family protein [Paracoccus cavernae]|uniref:ABZJ_00895 family protein n=1 Tax=Paracoccus cavernae TaxID=1571207 RepID=A0ABT8D6N3_9RHOB|nr:ABZJ_00895 family protein [Paracoccus cavernae]